MIDILDNKRLTQLRPEEKLVDLVSEVAVVVVMMVAVMVVMVVVCR